jgi:hypothetical protein
VPEFLLVPLLAFDRRGYRLGYGGGFYDRSLVGLQARGPVTAVGLAYSGQELAEVPRGPNDRPLDWVVTETETIATAGATAGPSTGVGSLAPAVSTSIPVWAAVVTGLGGAGLLGLAGTTLVRVFRRRR